MAGKLLEGATTAIVQENDDTHRQDSQQTQKGGEAGVSSTQSIQVSGQEVILLVSNNTELKVDI